jgi:hypothetical protein
VRLLILVYDEANESQGGVALVARGKAMTNKKSDGEKAARPRLSLASRLLGATFRTNLQVPLSEEPWRNRKPKGKNKGKRRT